MLDSSADRARNVSNGGKARVQLQMRDRYKRHPQEERATRCLHELLEKVKEQGAKEYFQVRAATVDLEIDPPSSRSDAGEPAASRAHRRHLPPGGLQVTEVFTCPAMVIEIDPP